ncbi:MAG TPA: twin transmembrane helix small protein [Zoogloea sp.]|uniref:twin transmembrane helix small protein n=1 Tax=Zoogloea sp. TaxID=49181 RepID=UPI002C006997|nr:twin transmembrane helix small protein [Zoogloea sp.]HMV17204.1 twin transmembrane helix small protein [Rhodocyclaceae bacterium]HMV63139.1 twin transmembrane helix small protein [Rhodocyclaceae bacterium]HMW51421.1 twin transmembrane helix small protein [Rhodocyclaceae bacterium]HMY48570.1 twin transmembrane helix small protein [Rhodocyclaceae bacterium]HMZ74895.1 twin transmembrane helix small protein [Rhodocyclaceae bacterium]
MVFKLAVVLMLVAVIVSLFSGLFFLYRDKGDGARVVRALTIRISLSVLLFLALLVAYRFGLYSQ